MNTKEYNTQRAGNVVSNILGVTRNSGASINRQHEWARMSEPQKNIMRRKYKDSDHDGIPDLWDCQKSNPFRQDTVNQIERKRQNIRDREQIRDRDEVERQEFLIQRDEDRKAFENKRRR
jgi:hypothetical protein